MVRNDYIGKSELTCSDRQKEVHLVLQVLCDIIQLWVTVAAHGQEVAEQRRGRSSQV